MENNPNTNEPRDRDEGKRGVSGMKPKVDPNEKTDPKKHHRNDMPPVIAGNKPARTNFQNQDAGKIQDEDANPDMYLEEEEEDDDNRENTNPGQADPGKNRPSPQKPQQNERSKK